MAIGENGKKHNDRTRKREEIIGETIIGIILVWEEKIPRSQCSTGWRISAPRSDTGAEKKIKTFQEREGGRGGSLLQKELVRCPMGDLHRDWAAEIGQGDRNCLILDYI